MFRILTSLAPLRAPLARASSRVASRACPAHAQRLICSQQSAVRLFSRQAKEFDEDEEEAAAVVPLSAARSSLVSSLSADLSTLDVSNEWTTEYIQQTGFAVKSNAENEGVIAERTVEGHQVRVTFRASDYNEPEEREEEAEEESEEPINEHVFFVDITNPAGKLLRVDCANAPDGELVLHSLSFPSSVSADPTTLPARKAEEDLPSSEGAMDFDDLNEASQEHLLDLFAAIGVDDDLALFVANQAQLVRTQKLVHDMTKLKEFAQ